MTHDIETLRVLAYVVDTGHPPPSALREFREMSEGLRFPHKTPTPVESQNLLSMLSVDHIYYRQKKGK